MKKVLVIKPDYNYFPIGIAYVIGSLVRSGIEFDYVDGFLYPEHDYRKQLSENDYLAVATGGLTGSWTFFTRLFKHIKSIRPDMHCILGGNITRDTNNGVIFDSMPVDTLVVGEAEETFPELLLHLDSQDPDLRSVQGLSLPNPLAINGYTRTKKRPRLDLVGENYLPHWDFFDFDRYGFQTMPVLTGRGCPGRCTFCSPTNGVFKGRAVSHTIDEVKMLNEKYDFAHFVFINETLFPDEEMIFEFCREYKKVEPHRLWHCLMRMDVSPEVLYAMQDSGCTVMNVGVESGSDRVLDKIQKDVTVEETKSFMRTAKELGIVTQASFMMANYSETEEELVDTVDMMLDMGVSGPMALTINYPGTLNYFRARKQGLIGDEAAYIDSLDQLYSKDYYHVISGQRSGTLDYLNLSAMPTEQLFHVVER